MFNIKRPYLRYGCCVQMSLTTLLVPGCLDSLLEVRCTCLSIIIGLIVSCKAVYSKIAYILKTHPLSI
jgi:hypothetical protein